MKYCFVFLILLVINFSRGQNTTEEETSTDSPSVPKNNTEIYESICVKDSPIFYDIDLDWVTDQNAKGDWHFEVADQNARLHIADILHGKQLPDNYSDFHKLCVKGSFDEFSLFFVNGTTSGFDNEKGHWNCETGEDALGKFDCEFSSDLTKYAEKVQFFPSYSDNKNFFVMVTCYPEKKAGWFVHSVHYPLTPDERQQIKNHVKQLGFDGELLPMYEDNCLE